MNNNASLITTKLDSKNSDDDRAIAAAGAAPLPSKPKESSSSAATGNGTADGRKRRRRRRHVDEESQVDTTLASPGQATVQSVVDAKDHFEVYSSYHATLLYLLYHYHALPFVYSMVSFGMVYIWTCGLMLA
jgi:hypothetical protein